MKPPNFQGNIFQFFLRRGQGEESKADYCSGFRRQGLPNNYIYRRSGAHKLEDLIEVAATLKQEVGVDPVFTIGCAMVAVDAFMGGHSRR